MLCRKSSLPTEAQPLIREIITIPEETQEAEPERVTIPGYDMNEEEITISKIEFDHRFWSTFRSIRKGKTKPSLSRPKSNIPPKLIEWMTGFIVCAMNTRSIDENYINRLNSLVYAGASTVTKFLDTPLNLKREVTKTRFSDLYTKRSFLHTSLDNVKAELERRSNRIYARSDQSRIMWLRFNYPNYKSTSQLTTLVDILKMKIVVTERQIKLDTHNNTRNRVQALFPSKPRSTQFYILSVQC